MKITTVGVFKDRMMGAAAIDELMQNGVSDSEISNLYVDHAGDLQDSTSADKVGSGTIAGAATGGVVGAIAGLLVASAVFPGLGTVLVGGPLLLSALGLTASAGVAATISGVITGAIAGGLVGGLTQIGISEEDAKLYEQNIKDGDYVVVTRTELTTAKHIIERHGAMNVKEYKV